MENIINDFNTSVEARGFHPTDTNIRVNEEEVTFQITNDIVVKYSNNILKAKSKILAVIKSYIASHSSQLGLRGPTSKIPFLESDKNAIFKAVGISKEELIASIKKVDANDIDTSNHLFADPFDSLCVIICGVFLKNDVKLLKKIKNCDKVPLTKQEKYNQNNPVFYVALYLSIRFYGAIYNKFFKYDPDPQVMDYTIESISGKFLIKKMANMLEFIQYHSETNIENMWDRVTRMSDVDIFYFISNLNNRLSNAVKIIANNYYENHKNNNKIGSDDANKTDPSGKAYTGDVASISADIDYCVRRVVTKFYSETVIDDKLLTMACNKTKLSKSRMLLILKKIRENRKSEPRMKEIITCIISYFLSSLGGKVDEIRSSKFAVNMIKAYSVSNTKDTFILAIKDHLQKLIHENLTSIVEETNANMCDRVKNSLYTYVVLFIGTSVE